MTKPTFDETNDEHVAAYDLAKEAWRWSDSIDVDEDEPAIITQPDEAFGYPVAYWVRAYVKIPAEDAQAKAKEDRDHADD